MHSIISDVKNQISYFEKEEQHIRIAGKFIHMIFTKAQSFFVTALADVKALGIVTIKSFRITRS